MTPDPDRSPIFVIGTGRSGTTLLRVMLNAHPRIYLTHETTFYVVAQRISRRLTGSQWLESYFKTFPFLWLGLDPEEVRSELPDQLDRKDLGLAFRAIMRCKAKQFGKHRYGDKTPFHSSHLKQIFADFPDARVIHIIRDPRSTVASLSRMPWASVSFSLNNLFVMMQMRQVKKWRDQIFEVRMEDLLTEPRQVMGSILDFVGEDWDERVLDHTEHAPADDVLPFPWLQSAMKKRHPATEGWREHLGPEWIRLIEFNHRKSMKRYGYERLELEREPSWLRKFAAVVADQPAVMFGLFRLIRLGWNLRGGRVPTIERQQELLLGMNPKAWRHYPGFEVPLPPSLDGD